MNNYNVINIQVVRCNENGQSLRVVIFYSWLPNILTGVLVNTLTTQNADLVLVFIVLEVREPWVYAL